MLHAVSHTLPTREKGDGERAQTDVSTKTVSSPVHLITNATLYTPASLTMTSTAYVTTNPPVTMATVFTTTLSEYIHPVLELGSIQVTGSLHCPSADVLACCNNKLPTNCHADFTLLNLCM